MFAGAQILVKRFVGDEYPRREPLIPIGCGPYDVLSYIFEICGEEDYRTTLRIAVVCRHWRDVVLSTLRAWAAFDFGSCPHDDLLKLYIQRSRPRSLHIGLEITNGPRFRSFALLKDDAERIECFSMRGTPGGGYENIIFPNVTRLTITSMDAYVPVHLINPGRFPNLRHFLCETRWSMLDKGVDFPPLESLALVFTTGFSWSHILSNCRNTLISLRVHLRSKFIVTQKICIIFPKLQCLEIQNWESGVGIWPLDLKTPVLETYIESEQKPHIVHPFHLDLMNVLYMQTDRVPPLHLLPKPRQLQLNGQLKVAQAILNEMRDAMLCPELELINQMGQGLWTLSWLLPQVTKINKFRTIPISFLYPSQPAELPGVIPRSCGYGAHLKTSTL